MCLLFCFVLFWILCCVVCKKLKIKNCDNKKKSNDIVPREIHRNWKNFQESVLMQKNFPRIIIVLIAKSCVSSFKNKPNNKFSFVKTCKSSNLGNNQ